MALAHLVLQLVALAFALLGTWLLRKPGPAAPWGFVAWLVSNPAAMAFMAIEGHWIFFAQHAVFLLLAIEGTVNWLWRPRADALAGEVRAVGAEVEHVDYQAGTVTLKQPALRFPLGTYLPMSDSCPVCGSEEDWHPDISGPDGQTWMICEHCGVMRDHHGQVASESNLDGVPT